jgi:Zn-dependent protease
VTGGLPIARIFGIEVRVSWVWAFLVAGVTFLGSQQAAVVAPSLGAVVHLLVGIVVAVGFLVTVAAHELAHALVGRRRGVPATAVTLGVIGGLAPLSIQAPRARDEFAIGVAGPIVSLVVAGLTVVLALIAGPGGGAMAALGGGLLVLGGLNLVLGLISLLPGLPLDGGRVVRALAWGATRDRDRGNRVAATAGRVLGWSMVGGGAALVLADMVTGGLLVLLLGWMLATGSRQLDKRLRLEGLLRGHTVGEAYRADVPGLDPALTIDTFADRYEAEDGASAYPVVEGDRVLGVIGVRRLQRLGRRRFATTRAAAVMVTPPLAPFLAPGDELWSSVELMDRNGLDGLAVVDDGRLAGMVTRESIGELIMRVTGGEARPTGRRR